MSSSSFALAADSGGGRGGFGEGGEGVGGGKARQVGTIFSYLVTYLCIDVFSYFFYFYFFIDG